jgi:hypothetical protein
MSNLLQKCGEPCENPINDHDLGLCMKCLKTADNRLQELLSETRQILPKDPEKQRKLFRRMWEIYLGERKSDSGTGPGRLN